MLLANFNGKEHLRHRAVFLRQHGFLVFSVATFPPAALMKLKVTTQCVLVLVRTEICFPYIPGISWLIAIKFCGKILYLN